MRKVCFVLMCACLVSIASAESITVTDGTGNSYGDCFGIAVDFDSALPAATAPWTPTLVNGQQYSLDSLSLRDNGDDTGNVYLGVYAGFTGVALSDFQGVSTNAVDFSTITNGDWAQFDFSGIDVTADATPGSGSGVLYFVFQTGTDAVTGAIVRRPMHRVDGFSSDNLFIAYGSAVICPNNGGVITTRPLEYKAELVIPEPATMVLMGLGALTLLRKRK